MSTAVFCLTLFCFVFQSFGHPTSKHDESGFVGQKDNASKGFGSRENVQEVQPHLILIIGDDIGWNDVGWNNPSIHTPFMNSLATEGVILHHYYSFSQCTPSRASILTGIYAHRLGLQRGVLLNEEPYGVPLNFSMLPEHLRDVGYQTHALGKWHVGYCNQSYTPTFRGFDSFLGFYNGAEENYLHCVSDLYFFTNETCNGFDFHNNTLEAPEYYGQYSTEIHTKRAVDIINNYDGVKPLFMHISITDMHWPVQSLPKHLAKCKNNVNEARKTFCGAMAALDESVQTITNALIAKKMWENTVLVFISDNGGSIEFGGNNYPLRGEKFGQWEGGLRVPAFVHSPLLKKKKYINNHLIHVTDWYPTFLQLAGAETVDGIDGVDQWTTISANKLSVRKDLPYQFDQRNGTWIAAIRDSKYKLIVGSPGIKDGIYTESETKDQSFNLSLIAEYAVLAGNPFNFSDKRIRLFDLENDPSESDDISATHPWIVQRMLKRVREYQKQAKSAIKLPSDPAGNPAKLGGWYRPGWCTARIHVPHTTQDIP